MSREILVSRPNDPRANENGMVPKHLAGPRVQSEDAHFYVIGDVMDPVKHMATGRIHDSKSRFRADTRAAGCVEVGNDQAIRRDPGINGRVKVTQTEVAQDVKRAIQELNSR